jgi:DNA-directed RNA polymerase subunit M/transcription elongation factor TFIIS
MTTSQTPKQSAQSAQSQEQRTRTSKLIAEACARSEKWHSIDDAKRASIVRKIERSCYNEAVMHCMRMGYARHFSSHPFVSKYSENCYRILQNMDPKCVGSSYLLDAVCSGNVDLDNIAQLPPIELCPEANKSQREEIEIRRQQKVEQKVSRRYTCRRCGCDRTVSLEYAPNCADEATKFSIKCTNCNYVWRT